MPDQPARRAKTREQFERELLETLRQRQHDWTTATQNQRVYARQSGKSFGSIPRLNSVSISPPIIAV
jgi:hypothetical protein